MSDSSTTPEVQIVQWKHWHPKHHGDHHKRQGHLYKRRCGPPGHFRDLPGKHGVRHGHLGKKHKGHHGGHHGRPEGHHGHRGWHHGHHGWRHGHHGWRHGHHGGPRGHHLYKHRGHHKHGKHGWKRHDFKCFEICSDEEVPCRPVVRPRAHSI